MKILKPVHVLILGGGFGGIYAARALEKELADEPNVRLTLVNRENFFLFTPMLHEVAASDLDITHIVNPIRKLLKRTDFFQGDLAGIDLAHRRVRVTHGGDSHAHTLEYDHLVLALGAVTNFFGLPGLEERALTMKSLGDALHLRNRMIRHLEEADFECSAARRRHLLTFVVAGGGFAGVETVAALNDFLREALPFYPHLTEEMLRVVLVHPGEYLLPELGEALGRYAQAELGRRGVEIRTHARVSAIDDRIVTLNDGTRLETGTLVWTAGTSPNPHVSGLPCASERGRVTVTPDLAVPGWPGVWALGDCAVIPHPDTGAPYPPTAQHALREGATVARNIAATLRGAPTRPFRFATLGQLASLGRRTGVARIGGRNFSGFLAWWMWRTIYLAKLPRWEKRLRVMLDWTLDLFCGKDLVQFQTGRAAELGQVMREEMGVGAAAAGAAGLAAAAPADDAADAAGTVERRAS